MTPSHRSMAISWIQRLTHLSSWVLVLSLAINHHAFAADHEPTSTHGCEETQDELKTSSRSKRFSELFGWSVVAQAELIEAIIELHSLVNSWLSENVSLSDDVLQALVDYGFFIKKNLDNESADWFTTDEIAAYWQNWHDEYESTNPAGLTDEEKTQLDAFVSLFNPIAKLSKELQFYKNINAFLAILKDEAGRSGSECDVDKN